MAEFPVTLDLHMHTDVSDGTDTPEEILKKVEQAEIDLFSITDHDAIEGSAAIGKMLACRKAGDSFRGFPVFINGIEFSCRDEHGKYHILGYAYDPEEPAINSLVQKAHGIRIKKVMDRLNFLEEEFGFTFKQADIDKLFKNANPGKPHIARLMIRYGYADSIDQAMHDYLDKKKYKNEYIRPEEAITAILESKGIPVLAHPPYGDGSQLIIGEEMDRRLRHLLDFGLMGAECYYSGFTDRLRDEMLDLADKYDLYVTAGSDYHGENKLVILGDSGVTRISEASVRLKRFVERVI